MTFAAALYLRMRRWLVYAGVGAALLTLAGVLLGTIDPHCEASGAYGNYCGLQSPHIWGYPSALAGAGFLIAGLVSRRKGA